MVLTRTASCLYFNHSIQLEMLEIKNGVLNTMSRIQERPRQFFPSVLNMRVFIRDIVLICSPVYLQQQCEHSSGQSSAEASGSGHCQWRTPQGSQSGQGVGEAEGILLCDAADSSRNRADAVQTYSVSAGL